jgi:pilus assembly protein Flp/PilA
LAAAHCNISCASELLNHRNQINDITRTTTPGHTIGGFAVISRRVTFVQAALGYVVNKFFYKGEKTMQNLKKVIAQFVADEMGQDLIEYALVAALIGLGCVASMSSLAGSIGNSFSSIGSTLSSSV